MLKKSDFRFQDSMNVNVFCFFFPIAWILPPGVLQDTLQSQECVTPSAAAPSTMKTASPLPLLWLTKRDMCRFCLSSSSSHMCPYFWALHRVTLCGEMFFLLRRATAVHRLFFFSLCPWSLYYISISLYYLYKWHGEHAGCYWSFLFVYFARAQKLPPSKVTVPVIISPHPSLSLVYISDIFNTSCCIFHQVEMTAGEIIITVRKHSKDHTEQLSHSKIFSLRVFSVFCFLGSDL